MFLRKHSKAIPIAQGNGILSIFPPLEMSRGQKELPSEGEMNAFRILKPTAWVKSL